jgi:hypothetical protein
VRGRARIFIGNDALYDIRIHQLFGYPFVGGQHGTRNTARYSFIKRRRSGAERRKYKAFHKEIDKSSAEAFFLCVFHGCVTSLSVLFHFCALKLLHIKIYNKYTTTPAVKTIVIFKKIEIDGAKAEKIGKKRPQASIVARQSAPPCASRGSRER